jgi:hypothetical protein
VTPNTVPGYLANLDYEQTDVQDLLAATWLEYYQTIVNLNTLLAEIDKHPDLFTNGNHDLIKGEAFGLRAFLHLEVMRLWGDAPVDINPSNLAIPYVTTVTKDPNELRPVTYAEVGRLLLADLDAAERLLADDPIISCYNSVLNSPGNPYNEPYKQPEDPYHYYRQYRFNYYAVKATKARYYQWIGNGAEAAYWATEVIDAINEDNTPKFELGNETIARISGRLTFPSEHIFAVHNSRASEVVTSLFIRAYGYTQNAQFLDIAYEKTSSPLDIRYINNRLWESRTVSSGSTTTFNHFMKYTSGETGAVEIVPLIRVSEMYFIVIEHGDATRFSAYSLARRLDGSIESTLTTPDAIRDRLEKEYRKEFYGEGQIFYFYKRHKYANFTWPEIRAFDVSKYKLPVPEAQTLFE